VLPIGGRLPTSDGIALKSRLANGLNRNAKRVGYVLMVERGAHSIYSFIEVHVYETIDKSLDVYDNIYIKAKEQVP
jgi:hypothetical protein